MQIEKKHPKGNATFLALFVTGVLLASVQGAVFNSINGVVSPLYFATILGWTQGSDIWWISVGQGALEGVVSGLVLSALLAKGLTVISRGACPFGMGLRFLCGTFASVSLSWTGGGLLAIFLAAQYPDFYRSTFVGVPSDLGPMIRYAWVGGSIWGAYAGALLGVTVALLVFRARWKRRVTGTDSSNKSLLEP